MSFWILDSFDYNDGEKFFSELKDSIKKLSEIDENYRDILPHTKYIFPTSSKQNFLDLKNFEDFKKHITTTNIEELPTQISITFSLYRLIF